MNTYSINQLDNSDILLTKIIIDSNNYIIINKENGDILLKKIIETTIKNIEDIKKYDFKNSIILDCSINNNKLNRLKYKSIIEHIYYLINDGVKIIINTKLNIKTIKKTDEGFYYLANIGISVQGVDSNKALLEIINQCTKNKISLSIKIKLIDNNIINILF